MSTPRRVVSGNLTLPCKRITCEHRSKVMNCSFGVYAGSSQLPIVVNIKERKSREKSRKSRKASQRAKKREWGMALEKRDFPPDRGNVDTYEFFVETLEITCSKTHGRPCVYFSDVLV